MTETPATAEVPVLTAKPATAGSPGSSSGSPVVGYAGRGNPRPRQGVNVRMIVFVAVVAAPFLGILYMFLKPLLTGGITQHDGYADVDLKALGSFPFNEKSGTVGDVPARFRALDGKRIVLQGFMYSPQSAGSYGAEFQFVYNVNKCCFGGPPQVQERVYGHTRRSEGVQLYNYTQFVRLTGILHVRVVRDEAGVVHSVYDMDVEQSEPING
jgi:hypothetical protein